MAVTDKEGRFTIENLPLGKHEFRLWHELPGAMHSFAIDNGPMIKKGRVATEIREGENHWPAVKLPPKLFEPLSKED